MVEQGARIIASATCPVKRQGDNPQIAAPSCCGTKAGALISARSGMLLTDLGATIGAGIGVAVGAAIRAALRLLHQAMRTRAHIAALVSLTLLLTGGAHAWGPAGHKAVGAVADSLLTPGARDAVALLLADDEEAHGRPSGRRTLAEVADWADEIRGTPGDRPRWHYDNRPVCGSVASTDAPTSAWCPQGDCASAQLPALLAVLADDGRTRGERSLALKWVVHLVGDLHQPLHAADLAEGGNRIRVAPYGKAAHRDSGQFGGSHGTRHGHSGESLHAFWDSHLVNLALHPEDGDVPDAAVARLLRRARATSAERITATPAQWAAESNRIARDFALNIDGVDCAQRSALDTGDEPRVTLSRAYVAQGRQIVEERLALAGARLARLINAALDPRE